jgi:hypothetical protein
MVNKARVFFINFPPDGYYYAPHIDISLLFLNFHLLSQMLNRKISRIQNKKSESNFSLLWNRRPLKSRISEIACSALTSKVSNNPTESTFIAAEEV